MRKSVRVASAQVGTICVGSSEFAAWRLSRDMHTGSRLTGEIARQRGHVARA